MSLSIATVNLGRSGKRTFVALCGSGTLMLPGAVVADELKIRGLAVGGTEAPELPTLVSVSLYSLLEPPAEEPELAAAVASLAGHPVIMQAVLAKTTIKVVADASLHAVVQPLLDQLAVRVVELLTLRQYTDVPNPVIVLMEWPEPEQPPEDAPPTFSGDPEAAI